MSTEDPPHQIVESIILTNLKLKPDHIKTANALSDTLESLVSLDLAIHISAGLAVDNTYLHVLHCRFNSYYDLKAFFKHPEYDRVSTNFLLPIADGPSKIADWTSNDIITESPKPGSAMKITLAKWKDYYDGDEQFKVKQVIQGIKDQSKEVEYISYGERSPFDDISDNKEYTFCWNIYFRGVEELEAFNSDAELQKSLEEKLKDGVESESRVVVDYMIHLPK